MEGKKQFIKKYKKSNLWEYEFQNLLENKYGKK